MIVNKLSPAERFWSKVKKTPTCWLWTACVQNKGYGWFGIDTSTPKSVLAHRFSYQQAFGPIPKGMNVIHSCDTPRCVRPSHLRLGTQADNIADCVAKDRNSKGEDRYNVKLNREAVVEIRALSGSVSQSIMARMFGVSRSAIENVVTRHSWNHVP